MEIQTKIAQVPTFDINISGLTREDVQDLVQDLTFLDDRLPNGLTRVMKGLKKDLEALLRQSYPIYREYDV
jgi:hypothetical protein